MIQDLQIKKTIITSQLDIIKRQCDYLEYKTIMSNNGVVNNKYLKSKIIIDNLTKDQLRVIENLNRGRQRRVKTLKDYIQRYVFNKAENNAYFGTLTLDDNNINKSIDTLKKYIKRHLKKYCKTIVLNIDYGSQNDRLHFHCVILCDDIEALKNDYNLGFTLFKPINTTENDKKKISKYINKLTYHAIKSSTPNSYNNCRCYYYTIY